MRHGLRMEARRSEECRLDKARIPKHESKADKVLVYLPATKTRRKFYPTVIPEDRGTMRLIRNQKGDGHAAAVEETLEGADRISLAVAFLKVGGANMIVPILEKRLEQGAKAEAFIGTDFYITEPNALEKLLALRDRCPDFEIFLADRGSGTFHPKTYVGRKSGRVRCLIGSANLTTGAMATNHELSLLAEVAPEETLSADLDATFEGYRDNGRFQPLHLVLDQYRLRHDKEAPKRRRLEENLPEPFDLSHLDDLIRQYRDDRRQSDYLAKRRGWRRMALQVQNQIAGLHRPGPVARADREILEEALSSLMNPKSGLHYWPSEGIYRHAQKAALAQPKKAIALFAEGREAARRGPSAGFEAMRKLALQIGGIGPNMITEILCTFDPGRFAVFNGNTAGALNMIEVGAPKSWQLKTFSGNKYAGVWGSVDAVRKRMDGADFDEVDAFLYWLTKRGKRG